MPSTFLDIASVKAEATPDRKHTLTGTHTQTNTCTYAHTYAHTHTYTYTHTFSLSTSHYCAGGRLM